MAESKPLASVFKFCPSCAAPNPEPGAIPFQCASCGYTNYFGPVAAVGAIVVNEKQEMLFVRRSRDPGKGKWGLPGGFVDPDESGEEAVIREVSEETGLDVISTKYLMTAPNKYEFRGAVASVIDLFYLVEVRSLDNIQLAVEEIDQYDWAKPDSEHLENMAFHSNRLAIEHWMQQCEE